MSGPKNRPVSLSPVDIASFGQAAEPWRVMSDYFPDTSTVCANINHHFKIAL
jgi:hypothetical protein